MRVGQCSVEACGQRRSVLEEVQKARTGNFDLADLLVGRQGGDQLFSQIARFHAGRLGEHHRDIAGEIAVRLVAGVFHLNRRRQPFWQDALGDETGQGLLNQLANGVFHCALFDRKRGGASMRGWKNSALSVAQACLPTA